MDSEQNPAAEGIDDELNETFIEHDGAGGKYVHLNTFKLCKYCIFR